LCHIFKKVPQSKKTYDIIQNQNKLKGYKMTQWMPKSELLTTQEKKERLARTYDLNVSKLRYFGLYKTTGMLWDYLDEKPSIDGWKKGTKFYVTKDGKAGIL